MWKTIKETINKVEEYSHTINILRGLTIFFVLISFVSPWVAKLIVYDKLYTRDEDGKLSKMIFSEKIGSLGTVGDWLGGSTLPWLTFATIFLLIETSIIQRKQIKLQREEMRENSTFQQKQMDLQKQEMEKTNEEFKIQNQTIKTQRFENTFFNMLTLHNQLIENLSFSSSGLGRPNRTSTGRSTFPDIVDEFYKSFDSERKRLDKIYVASANHLNKKDKDKIDLAMKRSSLRDIEIINYVEEIPESDYDLCNKFLEEFLHNDELIVIMDSYDKFYNRYDNLLGHYFKSLYRIIKYVDETNLIEDQEEKEFYTDFIRSQFSTFEQVLLFYNCLSDKSFCNFLPFLRKYNLLDGLDKSRLLYDGHYNEYLKYSSYPKGSKREEILEFFISWREFYREIVTKSNEW